MGRAKLKIEFIVNKKARALTFKRRKQGLIKKLQELVTLCGVDGCIFVHNPDADLQQTEIWSPGDPGSIRRMIDLYRAKKTDSDSGTRGVSHFDLGSKKNSVDFCDQGQSPAVDLSSGLMLMPMPMPMIQYSDFPNQLLMSPPDQQEYMDPLWMMDAVFGSQDWAASDSHHEFGYIPAQFFPLYTA